MSDDSPALKRTGSADPRPEAEYDAIIATIAATERGRWFLEEYAHRHRAADTEVVLAAIGRLEQALRTGHGSADPWHAVRRNLVAMRATIARAREEVGRGGAEVAILQELADTLDRTLRDLSDRLAPSAEPVGDPPREPTDAAGSPLGATRYQSWSSAFADADRLSGTHAQPQAAAAFTAAPGPAPEAPSLPEAAVIDWSYAPDSDAPGPPIRTVLPPNDIASQAFATDAWELTAFAADDGGNAPGEAPGALDSSSADSIHDDRTTLVGGAAEPAISLEQLETREYLLRGEPLTGETLQQDDRQVELTREFSIALAEDDDAPAAAPTPASWDASGEPVATGSAMEDLVALLPTPSDLPEPSLPADLLAPASAPSQRTDDSLLDEDLFDTTPDAVDPIPGTTPAFDAMIDVTPASAAPDRPGAATFSDDELTSSPAGDEEPRGRESFDPSDFLAAPAEAPADQSAPAVADIASNAVPGPALEAPRKPAVFAPPEPEPAESPDIPAPELPRADADQAALGPDHARPAARGEGDTLIERLETMRAAIASLLDEVADKTNRGKTGPDER